jgi:hypothetical protein
MVGVVWVFATVIGYQDVSVVSVETLIVRPRGNMATAT